ncbi:MAG: hypothetical protein ABSD03_15795 [Vulcanimicrobiaceae bacterium]|jgi:hypothetical protein
MADVREALYETYPDAFTSSIAPLDSLSTHLVLSGDARVDLRIENDGSTLTSRFVWSSSATDLVLKLPTSGGADTIATLRKIIAALLKVFGDT